MESWKITDLQQMEKVPNSETSIPQDYAKVKILRAGMSSTDIAVFNGQLGKCPITPCRIASGLISESPDSNLKKGERVLLSPYSRIDENHIKIHGIDIDGYLADYANVPLCDIYKMPEGISDESITFVEDISMALKMFEKLNMPKTSYILIYGASAINLIFASICMYYQTIPILVEEDKEKLKKAKSFNITYMIDSTQEDVDSTIKDITSGKLADAAVFDADLGLDIEQTLSNLKVGSKIGLYSYNTAGLSSINLDLAKVSAKNLTIFGLNNGIGEIETAVNLIATETIKLGDLIENISESDSSPEIFENVSKSNIYYKTIIKC